MFVQNSSTAGFFIVLLNKMKEKKERFIELLRSTGRQGIEEVINYLEESGFFTAPASTKYHLSYEGGLMEHCMNVYNMAIAMRGPIVAMKPEMDEKLPEKSIIIAALLHDICKANIYKKTQKWNKNDQGQWEQYDTYETDYSRMPVCYFAVLVSESGAPKPQLTVNNRTDVTVKFLHHVKNSTERGDFLRFNAYICHAIDDFACLELQH